MNQSWVRWVLLLILVAALGLQLFNAAQKSLWEDEAALVWNLRYNPAGVQGMLSWEVHPPLYVVLLSGWASVFGYSELALRSFSLIFLLLALIMIYALTRELFGDPTALLALALAAFSPVVLLYGSSVRYYSLVALLTLLAAYCLVLYLKRNHWLYLVGYILAATALLYSLYAAAVVLVACNLGWLASRLRKSESRMAKAPTAEPRSTEPPFTLNSPRDTGRSWWSLAAWVGAQILIAALFYPGYQLLSSVLQRNPEAVSSSNWMVEVARRLAYLGYAFSVGETISPANPVAWIGLLLVAVVAIYALVARRKSFAFWLLVVFFGVIALANLAISLNATVAITWQNLPYRAFYAYPFLVIWLAAGITAFRPRLAVGLAAMLLLVFAVGLYNNLTNRQYLRPIYTVPWRQIISDLQSKARPGAAVLCSYSDFACPYYALEFGLSPNFPDGWSKVVASNPPEVWYLRTNRTLDYSSKAVDDALVQQIRSQYPRQAVTNYAPQDASVRRFKQLFLRQDDFEYRVNVYQFSP